MRGKLEGQIAFVTGAASGIGRAAAIDLARHGVAVVLADCRSAEPVAETIVAGGGNALALGCDVSDETEVRTAMAAAAKWQPMLDIVVNCAGVLEERPLLHTDLAHFNRLISVNLCGTFLVGREAIQCMVRSGRGGRVINIASELAFLGREGFSAYCASKAGVLGLTRSWAREFAPDILVNAVAPGPVDTPMLGLENMSAEWREKESNIPLGRVGRAEEIAALITFLAGPGASFITGQVYGANGGAFIG